MTEKTKTANVVGAGANANIIRSPYAYNDYNYVNSPAFQKVIGNPENKIVVRFAASLYIKCKNWLFESMNCDMHSKKQLVDLLCKAINILERGELFTNLFIRNEEYDWKYSNNVYNDDDSIDVLEDGYDVMTECINDMITNIMILGQKRPDVYLAIETVEAYCK